MRHEYLFSILMCSLMAMSGCGESLPAEMVELRSQLMLTNEPAGAVTIEQARQQLQEDASKNEFVLKVRTGNKNYPNWSFDDGAVMVVSEAFPGSDYNVGPDHDASTCPFCRWKWKNEDSLAMLQIVNAEGEVLLARCDQLLDLQLGDTLTIQGEGALNEVGLLTVNLSGIFVDP